MPVCPSCGDRIPKEAVFCPNCGSLVTSAAAASSSSRFAAPGGDYPAFTTPAPKKKKTGLILGILAGLLVIAGVLAFLFFTGVLGRSSGPVGVWKLTSSTDSSLSPGQIMLVLSEGGSGNARIRGSETPLTWDQSAVFLNGSRLAFSLSKDSLTLKDSGMQYVFTRTQIGAAPGGVFSESGRQTQSFPYGDWGGEYVYNTSFFKVALVLNQDFSCARDTFKDGELVRSDVGFFQYSGDEIRLYLNGDINTFTAYTVSGEMMVNNNHEFFRIHPGGVIGGWIGEYDYKGSHYKSYYILRSDMTYSELSFQDGSVYEDSEGTYTFDGQSLTLYHPGRTYTTPFSLVNDTLINGEHVFTRG